MRSPDLDKRADIALAIPLSSASASSVGADAHGLSTSNTTATPDSHYHPNIGHLLTSRLDQDQDNLHATSDIDPVIHLAITMAPSNNTSTRSFTHSSPTNPASPTLRLRSITAHMASTSTTSFPAEAVPQAPEDPLFGLMAAYKADTFENKVDLGIGAYRDDDAKPWVLPVVKKVTATFNRSLNIC